MRIAATAALLLAVVAASARAAGPEATPRLRSVAVSYAGEADKAPAAAAPKADENKKVQYRGVNLGGWLVLESWMYPEWWKTTGVAPWRGEMQFVDSVGKAKAKELLEKHWDTWVTKDDLKTLKDAGIEHLRVPIGYWILGDEYLKEGETYLPGGWPYLMRMLGWCKDLGLKAIIDLHGAPGVQNGHDNCGFQGGDVSIKWDQPENLKRTTDVLVALAKNLTEVNKQAATKDTVTGLCLLNEPWTEKVGGPIKMDTLKQWQQEVTDAVLEAGWDKDIWITDGMGLDWEGWEGFLLGPKYKNVYVDTHIYLLFDPALWQSSPEQLTDYVCKGWTSILLDRVKGKIANGVVVGEYSLDFRQYPQYPYTPEQLTKLQNLLLAQQKQFGVIGTPTNAAVGAFFWSFKAWGNVNNILDTLPAENKNSPWDYLALYRDGVAPKDLATATFDCAAPANTNQPLPQPTPGVGTVGGGQ